MGLFVKLHGPDAGSQPDHGPWAGDALTRDLLPSLSALAASQAALFSCSCFQHMPAAQGSIFVHSACFHSWDEQRAACPAG